MKIVSGYAACPFQNSPPCGDGWLSLGFGTRQRLMLADGIGHGTTAHRIVTTLSQHLSWLCSDRTPMPDLEECLLDLHRLLEQEISDSQAAVALVDVDRERRELDVAIVGNVQVHYLTPELKLHFPSMSGMVGGRFPRQVHSTRTSIQPASLLAMFSDGLDAAAAARHLSNLHARSTGHGMQMQAEAQTMLQRFGLPSDDASCGLLWFEEVE